MSITFGRFAETAEQEDPREKRLKMLKRQVLQKKMQAVRQGGEGITASYEPAGEIVQELFGNKKYPYGKASKNNPRGKKDQAELDRAQAYLKKNPNFGRERGKKDQAELDRAQAYIKKNPNFGKKDVKEAKVDEKLPDYKRATARDKRYGNPHGSHELGGGIRKDRRADHENRRGVKEEEIPRGPGGKPIRIKDKIKAAKGQISNEGKPTTEGYQRDPEQSKKDRTHSKQPDPSKDGFTGIGNMSIKDIMKMNAKMKKEKKKEVKEDKALAAVKASIIKKHGKGAIYDPKKKQSSADKAKVAAERKKRQDSDNKAYAARAKKAGFKSTQDYTDVVARYGSEDNYKKGKGLGT